MNDGYRDLTMFEREVITKILDADPTACRHLVPQVEMARVHDIDDVGSIQFLCDPGPEHGNIHKIGPEGECSDEDGMCVRALVFERSGTLCALQIYKDDGTPIRKNLTAADFRVIVL